MMMPRYKCRGWQHMISSTRDHINMTNLVGADNLLEPSKSITCVIYVPGMWIVAQDTIYKTGQC